jgi:hypothetical protein
MDSVQQLTTGLMVWGLNPGMGNIFCTKPDQPWGQRTLLHNGYLVFFPGVKSGQGVAMTTHPLLAPRLKKEYSCASTHPLELYGLF